MKEIIAGYTLKKLERYFGFIKVEKGTIIIEIPFGEQEIAEEIMKELIKN